jgi:hypothetical protein
MELKLVDELKKTEAAQAESRHAAQFQTTGPGTELKSILKNWFGIEANLGCSCNAMAARMNSDPAWCLTPAGMEAIVSAMRNEHQKRRQRGETILPWADFGARQLVKLACRRAARATAKPQDAAEPVSAAG